MAIMNRGTSETEVQEKEKPVYIDPDSTSIPSGEVRRLNFEIDPEDAWTMGAPPQPGFYRWKVLPLGKTSITQKLNDPADKNKGFYYSVAVELEIVGSGDKEIDGYTQTVYVSTNVYRGKEISTMAALILLAGVKLKTNELSDGDLLAKFITFCKLGKVLARPVFLNWEATYEESSGNWKKAIRNYQGFPIDANTGHRIFECRTKCPDGKERDVRARSYIQWGLKEAEKAVAAKADNNDDLDVGTPVKAAPAPVATPAPKPKAVTPTVVDLDEL